MTMLRLTTASDARAIAEIYGSFVTNTAISFEVEAPAESEIERRIVSTLRGTPWLVCSGNDAEVLGYAYGSRHHERAAYQWSVDVSVYVREGYHRRGIGRALYTSLLALLKIQGFYVAHAGITLPNPGSVRLHESCGFLPVGVYPAVGYKFGAWRDVGWWRLPLRELVAEPAPPLSLDAAERKLGWEDALASGLPLLRV
jgi:phosphinothricin acetyltransferase